MTDNEDALRCADLVKYLKTKTVFCDGVLVWSNSYHGAKQGKPIGSVDKRGYIRVQIGAKRYAVHRLVFLLHHGWLPDEIDHIDGDKSNNRIGNLRAATKSQNRSNVPRKCSNSSGIKGVSYHKASGRWSASVTKDRKRWQWTFPTKEQAAEAVRQKRQELHGEFARHF